jgi:UPF0716 family protein affecting phage T7 exclusion
VADRFSWSAALLPPLHAMVHGLRAMLVLWVTKVIGLVAISPWIGGGAAFWLYVLVAVWFGFAASGFARRKAGAARTYQGDWVAEGEDAALVAYLKGRAAV